jgi:hypothetical protein
MKSEKRLNRRGEFIFAFGLLATAFIFCLAFLYGATWVITGVWPSQGAIGTQWQSRATLWMCGISFVVGFFIPE